MWIDWFPASDTRDHVSSPREIISNAPNQTFADNGLLPTLQLRTQFRSHPYFVCLLCPGPTSLPEPPKKRIRPFRPCLSTSCCLCRPLSSACEIPINTQGWLANAMEIGRTHLLGEQIEELADKSHTQRWKYIRFWNDESALKSNEILFLGRAMKWDIVIVNKSCNHNK